MCLLCLLYPASIATRTDLPASARCSRCPSACVSINRKTLTPPRPCQCCFSFYLATRPIKPLPPDMRLATHVLFCHGPNSFACRHYEQLFSLRSQLPSTGGRAGGRQATKCQSANEFTRLWRCFMIYCQGVRVGAPGPEALGRVDHWPQVGLEWTPGF